MSIDERRHWCNAQCSESTGTSSAPSTSRNGCTTGPAAIRLSLLASPSRHPFDSVAMVTGRPAKPTTPLITTSAMSHISVASATTSISPSPDSASLTSFRAVGSATATIAGRKVLACSIMTAAERPVERPTTSNASGSAEMISRVWPPIEPVEPAIATRIGAILVIGYQPAHGSRMSVK